MDGTIPRAERRWAAVGEGVAKAGLGVMVTHVLPEDEFQKASEEKYVALLGRPLGEEVLQHVVDASGTWHRRLAPLVQHVRFCRGSLSELIISMALVKAYLLNYLLQRKTFVHFI